MSELIALTYPGVAGVTRVQPKRAAYLLTIGWELADGEEIPDPPGSSLVTLDQLNAALADALADITTGGGVTSGQLNAAITAVLDQLRAGAPTALDTLDELAAALGDDAGFAATVTAALGARLRTDAAQSLTGGQQAQARTNLGLGDAATRTVGTAAGTVMAGNDTRVVGLAAQPRLLLIDNAAALPPGTPAGTVVVVRG